MNKRIIEEKKNICFLFLFAFIFLHTQANIFMLHAVCEPGGEMMVRI